MKKVLLIVGSLIILCVGIFTYSKMNPPLVVYPSAYTTDKQIQLIDIGNRSPFGEIQVAAVSVNNNNVPAKVKIQVSDPTKGFTISDDEEKSEYIFKELDAITLKPKTDPQKQLDKVNAGTATKDDMIYALTVAHDESIHQVIIKYRHLGISREMIVSID